MYSHNAHIIFGSKYVGEHVCRLVHVHWFSGFI